MHGEGAPRGRRAIGPPTRPCTVEHGMTLSMRIAIRFHRFATNEVLRLATLLAIAVFLLDWATKSWALQHLYGATVPFGSFSLGVERNPAFAFSSGEGYVSPWLVVAMRLAALGALVLASRRVPVMNRRYACGFALLLAGGFGNAGDIVFREGAVVDFIGAGPFAFAWAGELVHLHVVFNAADVAVVIGLILIAPLVRKWAFALQRRAAGLETRWFARRAPLA
jgi:lipoprotein signal peptidase